MQGELHKRNKNIGYAYCVPSIISENLSNTNHGSFMAASSLAYQLNPLGFNFEIKTNIAKMNEFAKSSQYCSVLLPFYFFSSDCELIPND